MMMIFFTIAAKFTFPKFVSYSAVGIGLYLFYRKKIIAQFKIIEKMISHHICLRENDDLPLWRAPAIKKKPPFFMCVR